MWPDLEAEGSEGVVSPIIYMPRSMAVAATPEENALVYLYRRAYTVTSRQLGFFLIGAGDAGIVFQPFCTRMAVPATVALGVSHRGRVTWHGPLTPFFQKERFALMTSHPSRVRFPLMACGLIALLMALWAGLMRLGWELPSLHVVLPFVHGPLMVGGFLGTLIGVERAVALGQRWPYIAPLLTGVAALLLVSGFPAAWLMTFGSLGLLAVFGLIVHRQPALATVTMACGALLWCIGNGLWWAGWPLFRVTPWWAGFLVLTIAGERLELSRLLRLSPVSHGFFLSTVSMLCAGLMLAWFGYDWGIRLFWLGMIGLAVWLLRYDIARRTVRQPGLTRFIAVCLLSGYPWLGISGLLGLHFGSISAGPAYDAVLHALFLGFVVTMLFGHAPVIFPSVLGRAIRFCSLFYVPFILLHVSLLFRIFGDLGGWAPGRQWGGLVNAVALLLFLGMLAHAVWQGARAPE